MNYEHNDCDALSAPEGDVTSTQITLTDGFGKMNKRKQAAVIKYSERTDPTNWYRAQLMLYYPWYDEQVNLLGGYETFEQHYNHVKNIVHNNQKKYTNTDMTLVKMAHLCIYGIALLHLPRKVECIR